MERYFIDPIYLQQFIYNITSFIIVTSFNIFLHMILLYKRILGL